MRKQVGVVGGPQCLLVLCVAVLVVVGSGLVAADHAGRSGGEARLSRWGLAQAQAANVTTLAEVVTPVARALSDKKHKRDPNVYSLWDQCPECMTMIDAVLSVPAVQDRFILGANYVAGFTESELRLLLEQHPEYIPMIPISSVSAAGSYGCERLLDVSVPCVAPPSTDLDHLSTENRSQWAGKMGEESDLLPRVAHKVGAHRGYFRSRPLDPNEKCVSSTVTYSDRSVTGTDIYTMEEPRLWCYRDWQITDFQEPSGDDWLTVNPTWKPFVVVDSFPEKYFHYYNYQGHGPRSGLKTTMFTQLSICAFAAVCPLHYNVRITDYIHADGTSSSHGVEWKVSRYSPELAERQVDNLLTQNYDEEVGDE